ncbi:hypothetical protein NL108_014450 [Boleophthalmus pectinirostris]|nr:hypothetical protein NL108_014450 [Boleophthalmus pectinirostris]
MRHVTIINTALCLLVEDCILISLSYDSVTFSNHWECGSLIFFWNFFDFSYFFWMLVSSLLLYCTTSLTFSNMSNVKMFTYGFAVGYGPPLLMATITVAFTAPQGLYVTEDGLCLLVKGSSKTFLYLAVPVLTIVLANLVLLSVVLSRIVRNSRAVIRVANGKLLVRLVFLLISFLLFGLPRVIALFQFNVYSGSTASKRLYITFAIFNSLQGLWILVFGPLFDSKIRLIMCKMCQRTPDE